MKRGPNTRAPVQSEQGAALGGYMKETFTFPATAASIGSIAVLTAGLRKAGFKTRVVEETISRFPVLVLVATPPFRPNRKTRGCDI